MKSPPRSRPPKLRLQHLLNQSAKDLAAYLEHILPAVFDDWWQTGVMSKLSYQQQQRTSPSGLTSLSGFGSCDSPSGTEWELV